MLEYGVQVQPSSCMCAWVASFWTANHKRLLGKDKTPALAMEALMAQVKADDKPLKRTCR
jgi:hypothetical protein